MQRKLIEVRNGAIVHILVTRRDGCASDLSFSKEIDVCLVSVFLWRIPRWWRMIRRRYTLIVEELIALLLLQFLLHALNRIERVLEVGPVSTRRSFLLTPENDR